MADATIAFVDLAGFTALTQEHGDEAAVDLVENFTTIARQAADQAGAHLVKSIGDAVMLAGPAPEAVLRAVRQIFDVSYDRDGLPEPRAGLHHGAVVDRDADYFGATVNLAARVAGRASSGQALVTSTILDAARCADLEAVALGAHHLRNLVDPVLLWAIELCPTQVDTSIDPVCRMRISCQAAVARVHHSGTEHVFCSLACVAKFAADPDRYLPAGGTV